jgi:hypothetical protein
MELKGVSVLGYALDVNMNKFKDQLKAIEMATGALHHNLNEIDALYAEGEENTYTETMTKPIDPNDPVNFEIGDIVLIQYASIDGVSGSYGKILSNHRNYGNILEIELVQGKVSCEAGVGNVTLVAKAVK